MASWRHYSLLLLSTFMLFQDVWTASTDGAACPSSPPYPYHLDIFEELLSNHTDLADSLDLAPVLLGMNTNAPAYKFRGYGFHLTSVNVSNAIRAASCSSNEVTLSTGILFTDSDADGTLFELTYADRAEAGVPVYAVQMDAPADEIRVAYRHQGQLHTEVIPTRLHGGRWRTYAIELSGNQLTLYVNCEKETQRLVPLPDYCINDADVVVTVADTAYSHSEEFSGRERLYVFLQNLGIQFGPGGVNRYCPNLPEACPTCGQYLTMVEKVFTLQNEVAVLEQQVASLEATGVASCSTANDATSTDTNQPNGKRMNDCVDDTHPSGEIRTFQHDTFTILADGRICYCNDGNKRCTTNKEVCVVDKPVTSVPPSGVADTDAPPSIPGGVCRVPAFGNIELRQGDYLSRPINGECQVYSCVFKVAGFAAIDDFYSCNDPAYQNCSGLASPLQKEVSSCCGICDECSVKRCPANEECVLVDGQTSCRCMTGFQRATNGQCIDVDECSLGTQERGHNCPINSTCNNTIGSFDCYCYPGFDMAISSGGIRRCEDIDECEENPCKGANTQCSNQVGSYECICQTGYAFNKDGECIPVCDPPCQNGGACVSPNTCNCIPGYTGMNCEADIDECANSSTNNCHGLRAECINTRGGHFCRCSPGFEGNGTHCEDVNECRKNTHNCVEGSICNNTIGEFRCLCPSSRGLIDCTGMCKRRSLLIENGGWGIDNCINCTCLNGERSCRRVECDCSNLGEVPSECCNCNRRVCDVQLASGKSVEVRPSFTYFDPSDRCQRYDCFRNLTSSHTNLTANCPTLNCPPALQTLPMGKCCPVCMLPTCTDEYEGKVISFRNGCEICTCSSGGWDCQDKVQCPEINCSPENIVFNKDGCCPVCVETVLQLGDSTSCLAS